METWKETLQAALNERFDSAFAELSESNADVKKAVKQQMDTSALVRNHPRYDNDIKKLVDQYFEAMQLLSGEYSRHLYIQGAKDCVTVLRELGVIR